MIIEVANDIDMHLSSEVLVTQRRDVIPESRMNQLNQIAHLYQMPGLIQTLQSIRINANNPPLRINFFKQRGSFRFEEENLISCVQSNHSIPAPIKN
jgi:hypothetical protein